MPTADHQEVEKDENTTTPDSESETEPTIATHGVVDRVATPAEHAALAAAVGWQSHFDDQLRAASLAASLAGVVFVDAHEGTVGMARAVGDGLQYAYIQDVIVHPDHEGKGIATELVKRLVELLRPAAEAEIFIGLFASDAAVGVYESLGFQTSGATGMHQRISGES